MDKKDHLLALCIEGDSCVSPESIYTNHTCHEDLSFTFRLNADAQLLAEHFPGYPIAPASLTMQLVWDNLIKIATPNQLACFKNVRFSKPVIPDGEYSCVINHSNSGVLFTITNQNSEICVRGLVCF